jgi:hypothetical protein
MTNGRCAYEMGYGRGTPMRDTPMRWPMGDTRLWERHAYEKRAYEMVYGRGMPMRDTPIYIGWRKRGSLRGRRGVEGGSADLSRSTRRDITWPNLRRCLRHCWRLSRARHTFPGNHIKSLGVNLRVKGCLPGQSTV